MGILKLGNNQNARNLGYIGILGGIRNARILKVEVYPKYRILKLEGYQRDVLNTGIPK